MINTNVTSTADLIDVRDVIEWVEGLEETSNGSVVDGIDGAEYKGHEDDHDEYARLKALLDELASNGGDEQWRGDWYPVTLIRDSYFTEYAEQLAEDIGAISSDAAWPCNRIDWDAAASDLQQDYTTVEYAGVTYWYR